MKMVLSTSSLVLAAALLTIPAVAQAQSPPGQGPAIPREAPGAAMPSNGPAAAAPNNSPAAAAPGNGPAAAAPNSAAEARVEAHIKDLRAKLRITPAEQQQWDQFAQVMRDNARDMDQAAMERAQQLPSMNASQDMHSYEQLAEEHAQHLQKLVPAFDALYNAMSPEQKQVADQVFRAGAEQRAQNRRVQ